MSIVLQEIHLLTEVLLSGCGAAHGSGPTAPPPLRVPFAPSRLLAGPEGPTLQDLQADAGEVGALAEPFRNPRRQLRLLVTFPPSVSPQVNGERALHRVVLKAGDAFQWTAELVVHVTVFNRPQLGPPPETQVGKACPVCRVPFTSSTTVYTCACRAVFHCEPDEGSGLQCARLSGACPRCQRAVVLQEGYAYAPSQD